MAIRSISADHPRAAFQSRRRTPEVKREAVLLTAAHLFLKKGYRATSMEDISGQLQVTKPALYHYFKSKEEILIGCYTYGLGHITLRLNAADKTTGSGLQKTRAFLRAWIEVMTTWEFGQCVVTLDDNELSPKAREEVRMLKRRIDRTLRKRISEGVKDGTIKPCDVRLVAFAFGGAINSLGAWYNPEGKLNSSEFAIAYTDILTDGVSMSPKPMKRKSARSKR